MHRLHPRLHFREWQGCYIWGRKYLVRSPQRTGSQVGGQGCQQSSTEYESRLLSSTPSHAHTLPPSHPIPPRLLHGRLLSHHPLLVPETMGDQLSCILGSSHLGGHPPCSFNTHLRWGLHISVDEVVSENVPGAQALHTTFSFAAPWRENPELVTNMNTSCNQVGNVLALGPQLCLHTHTYASMYTHAHTCTRTCFPGLPSYPVRFPTNLELSVTHAWIC